MITQNKKNHRAYSKTINDTKAVYMSINLSGLDSLPVPLQSLAKAKYYLSAIHDELAHTLRDNIINRSKIGHFAANIHTELKKSYLAFLEYAPDIKVLIKLLSEMVSKLDDSLYADDILTISDFHNIAKQILDIHECLERACLRSLSYQVGGNKS